ACFKGDRFTGQIYEEFKQGSGAPDADFIIYIATMYDSNCGSNETVAFAAHCMQSLETGRPLAGHTNICPNQLIRRPRNHHFLLSTLKHELAHALGMSASLFGSFRDENGRKMPKSDVVQSFTFADWYTRLGPVNHTVSYIVTPNVKKYARQHFNCSTLIGAELENQGSQGTAGTHWEKRVFENEGMAGTHTQNPVYSGLTLAIMQDTGWYEVEHSLAENLHWGKNLGCDFAQKSCAFWIRSRRDRNESIEPFCDIVKPKDQKATRTRCTLDMNSVSQCTLVEYEEDLPIEYQIYDSLPDVDPELIGRYGGSVSLADYCPYQQEFEWKASRNNRIRDSRCFLTENTPDRNINFAMEEYGPRSKCFLHGNTSWIMKKCSHFTQNVISTSGCHEFLCQDGLLWITLLNQTYKYPCFKDGQKISIRKIWRGWAHEGMIICPSCPSICGDKAD
uniref:Leishmanolysin-like peptidase n=1 Tax=Romanomermis culicivorax TaxID=13658 RepID=A0A915HSS1_ROMCU